MIKVIIVVLIILWIIGALSKSDESEKREFVKEEERICRTIANKYYNVGYVDYVFDAHSIASKYSEDDANVKRNYYKKVITFCDRVSSFGYDEEGEPYIIMGDGNRVSDKRLGWSVVSQVTIYLNSEVNKQIFGQIRIGDSIVIIGVLTVISQDGFVVEDSVVITRNDVLVDSAKNLV